MFLVLLAASFLPFASVAIVHICLRFVRFVRAGERGHLQILVRLTFPWRFAFIFLSLRLSPRFYPVPFRMFADTFVLAQARI